MACSENGKSPSTRHYSTQSVVNFVDEFASSERLRRVANIDDTMRNDKFMFDFFDLCKCDPALVYYQCHYYRCRLRVQENAHTIWLILSVCPKTLSSWCLPITTSSKGLSSIWVKTGGSSPIFCGISITKRMILKAVPTYSTSISWCFSKGESTVSQLSQISLRMPCWMSIRKG